jgi:ABC-type amino acid transport substrate-binding protein
LIIGAITAKGKDQLADAVLDAIKSLQADGTEAKLYKTYLMDTAMSLPAEIKKE